jgi:hypothetical protein
MIYRTYQDLRDEVLREADAEAEDFVQEDEIKGYFNDAIREALSHIQKIGLEDDYFQKSVKLSLVNGQTEIDLPADVFAAKIRGLIYATPTLVYEVKRIKGPQKFAEIQRLLQTPSQNAYYQYDLENPSPTSGFKIKLYPISYETLTNCLTLNYVRTVERIVDESDLVDIPEFYSFIKAFVLMKIFAKENDAQAAEKKADYEKEKLLMLETLSEMTPDYDNKVIGDVSFYQEHN